MLVGPLENSEGPAGLLILIAKKDSLFGASELAFALELLEPFSAALRMIADCMN